MFFFFYDNVQFINKDSFKTEAKESATETTQYSHWYVLQIHYKPCLCSVITGLQEGKKSANYY